MKVSELTRALADLNPESEVFAISLDKEKRVIIGTGYISPTEAAILVGE